MDFLISPAYSVPPINTVRFSKEMMMNVSEWVPSTEGSALKLGAQMTVNPASCSKNSSSEGRINNWWENRLCHANSLITWMGRRCFLSAPAKPL